jgi:hypothetical protein
MVDENKDSKAITTTNGDGAALIPSAPFAMSLEPTGFDKAWEVAAMMARIGFCGCTQPEEALARIMYGRNLGMTTMAAMANVHVIEGRPGIEAATMRGICLQRPDVCEKFEIVSSSPKGATVRGKRVGHDQVLEATFTIEDAERAQLTDRGSTPEKQAKNNWNRYPEDMCVARASARLARRLFPDLIRGFSTTEELQDMRRLRAQGLADADAIDTTGETTPAAVVAATSTRDYRKEAEEFKARIIASKSPEEMKTLRNEFAKHEGNPHLAEIKDVYNDTVKARKKTPTEAKLDEEPKPEGAT